MQVVTNYSRLEACKQYVAPAFIAVGIHLCVFSLLALMVLVHHRQDTGAENAAAESQESLAIAVRFSSIGPVNQAQSVSANSPNQAETSASGEPISEGRISQTSRGAESEALSSLDAKIPASETAEVSEAAAVEPTRNSAQGDAGQQSSLANGQEGMERVPSAGSISAETEGQGVKASPSADLMAQYRLELAALIDRQKNYPSISRRMGQEARVVVVFRLDSSGNLLAQPELERSSRYAQLNEAALSAVNKAAPFPPVPAGSMKSEFRIEIVFQLE